MSFKLPGGGSIRIDETNITLPVSLRSATDGAGVTGLTNSSVTLTYWRQGGSATPIVAGPITAVDSVHSDGAFIEMSSGSQPGTYRLDVPDAAFVQGADWVVVEIHAPTTSGAKMQFTLTEDGMVRAGTAQAGAAGTITLDANASTVTNAYVGQSIFVASGTGVDQMRLITSYDTATQVATVIPLYDTTPDSDSIFLINADYGVPQSLMSYDLGDSRLVQEGMFALRNKVDLSSSVGTVYATDDTTSSWTMAVTRTNVNALTDIDPA